MVLEAQHIVLLLFVLNVFQFVFWSWQVHSLVNKLMSRNWADYSYAPPVKVEDKQQDVGQDVHVPYIP